MKANGKLIAIIGALALATVVTTSAFAQMGGGGMMGGGMMGGGLFGGLGSGGGNAAGMMGGNASNSRDDNGYGPGTYGARRDAPPAPYARGSEPSDGLDLGPLNQLDLNRQQLGEISIIRDELRDRQSNAGRRLKIEQEKLRDLYDSPKRDQSKIDSQFQRIERLRREMFESSVNAQDRIAAQLNAQQRQRLQRIAPRWNAGG